MSQIISPGNLLSEHKRKGKFVCFFVDMLYSTHENTLFVSHFVEIYSIFT